MAINTPVKAYKEMASKWQLPLALWGGTAKMRHDGEIWLPRLPDEDVDVYQHRLKRTFLFNVYKRTIQSMVGDAFTNNISVSGIPKELEYIEWNANGQGQSLTEHAAELFEDILIFGKCHNYVDFPTTDIERVSNVEYLNMGLKPYFARVSPISLIGWEASYNNGYEQLQSIRILDSETRLNSDFLEETREIVRLVTPETITLYGRDWSGVRLSTSGDWKIIDEPVSNSLGYIPLQTAYSNKKGLFEADPTLEDLAWINLQHYQSQSDQDNILHIARVPFLLGVGFEEKDNITIAANNMVSTSNKDADIRYVEHNGKAIESGRQHGLDLEEKMNKVGAEILYNKSVSRQTTSNRDTDKAEALSVAQRSLRSIEQMLEQCYLVAGDWLDLDKDFEPVVNIGADLDLVNDPNPIQGWIELVKFTRLSPAKALEEAKRRGILAKHLSEQDLKIVYDVMEEMSSTNNNRDEPINDNLENDNEPENSREDNN